MKELRATAANPRRAHYADDPGPWSGPSLDARLTHTTREHHDVLLADDQGARLDGAELDSRVSCLAGGLVAAGVEPGDAVAWQMSNRVEAVLCYRACWRIGALAAPIHHRSGPAEVGSALRDLDPALVIAESAAPLADAPGAVIVGRDDWDSLGEGEPVTGVRPHRAEGDATRIEPGAALSTSGSSGAPKIVLHDARALAYKASQMVMVHGLTEADAVLMPAPLAHVSGLLNGLLVPQSTPFRAVLMSRWDADSALELIAAEKITFMVGPPTFFVGMMQADSFSAERVASLRLVSSGGAGVTPAFCEQATRVLGARVKRTYGSTEAPTVATSEADHTEAEAHRHDGRPLGEVEMKVVDPERGVEVAPGTEGELWLRGPELSVGYLQAEATARSFTDDGWFRSGDLATLSDGWLAIGGRADDVIIRGGENVSAGEVEAVLESHPKVATAVVVGYPCDLMGERLAAFVAADPGFDVDASARWCESHGLARFKHPEQVVVLDEIPVLGSGKPDRANLRSEAARRFGPR